MFTERDLSPAVAAVREDDVLVLDCDRDFETLPPAEAEDLALLVDDLEPFGAPAEWLPADAPELLREYAGPEFTVGMPGDGSVAWTTQTDPPVVVCKPRLDESPEAFADFLVAEAIVQATLGEPEHFLGFFEDQYPGFDTALGLSPVDTYQVAAACYDAYLGLATRDIFADWEGGTTDPLFAAWVDAGDRLTGRIEGLPEAVARGRTGFADAAELACSGIKHAVEVPPPFDALDADVYREHGAAYAVRWAEKTAEAIDG
jgi:hypothetical protein